MVLIDSAFLIEILKLAELEDGTRGDKCHWCQQRVTEVTVDGKNEASRFIDHSHDCTLHIAMEKARGLRPLCLAQYAVAPRRLDGVSPAGMSKGGIALPGGGHS